MGMRRSLTEKINSICNQLDTNSYLSQDRRRELLAEIEDLVEKRRRFDEIILKPEENKESNPTCLSSLSKFLDSVSLTMK